MGLQQSVISAEVSATVVSPQVTDTAAQSDPLHETGPSLPAFPSITDANKDPNPDQLAAEWCESQPV